MKRQEKSEGVAIVLAVLVGLIGFYGVGHMYVGRIRRGLVILFLDWVISIPSFFSLVVGLSGDIELLVLGVVLLVGSLILWIWQIFDARRVCREHNQGLHE
jgi:TM2 domain-containing membrane protein YozV